MAVLTPAPNFYYTDEDGAPLALGKVYTYAAGTTTPLDTYTSNTGGTANTNPVILGADGRANIWLSNALYKFVITDSADALIATIDYVGGSNVMTGNLNANGYKITNLGAGSANGDSIRWQQSAAGVMTTEGDTLYASAANTPARLAIGAAGSVLHVNSGATAPEWQAMATQSDQETATSVVAPVTPGRQQFHPSACKGWCEANINGTIVASYNVASVTDAATGVAEINWATDFTNANYCAVGSGRIDMGGSAATTYVSTIRDTNFAAGVTGIQIVRASDGAAADPTVYMVAAFGDQA